jgi:hypothetical protein
MKLVTTVLKGIIALKIFLSSSAQAEQLILDLGQGVSDDGQIASICRKGNSMATVAPQTWDRFTVSPLESSLTPCGPSMCGFDPSDSDRPYYIGHAYSLSKTAGIQELPRSTWADTNLESMKRSDPGRFKLLCGSNFVRKIERGGTLSVRVKASFRTEEERTLFLQESQFDLANLRTMDGHLQKALDIDGMLQITLHQVAGDQAAFNKLMDQPGRYLLCRLRQASGCVATMQAVLKYGLGEWSDALNRSFTEGDLDSLQVLHYEVEAYP